MHQVYSLLRRLQRHQQVTTDLKIVRSHTAVLQTRCLISFIFSFLLYTVLGRHFLILLIFT